ncbi:MAG TPA: PIG-L deacetylase family protein [Terriglobales bacterium]|nr:PIG-L deacetylase family protein [Terriglobales bacterium]
MPKILCVTAHPDDEVVAFGGTVRRYSRAGVECRLICLTSGEAARNRGGAASAADLQVLRRGELAASCRLLGFAEYEAWDFPDAHLPQVDFYSTAGRIVKIICEWKPDLVMTLGPEGSATGHPDHGMAGLLTTAAFHWAAQERYFPESQLSLHQAARLYYSTTAFQPPEFPRVCLPNPDLAIDTSQFLELKIEAFAAHRTQNPLLERVTPYLRRAGGGELFHLACGTQLPEGQLDDLFAGMMV